MISYPRRIAPPAAVAIITVGLGAWGCSDRPDATDPTEHLSHPTTQTYDVEGAVPVTGAAARTLDARFARIATRIPGFGGVHFDRAGNLIVRSAFGAELDQSRLRAELAAEFGPDPMIATAPMFIQTADFDYVQLYTWLQSVRAVASVPAVTILDIAEDRNRVLIGVTGVDPQAFKAGLAADLDSWGVPREAVVVDEHPRVVPAEEVTDRLRPIFGGIQIMRQLNPAECTLGFVVQAFGEDGIITNSHCTNVEGYGPDFGITYQNTAVEADRIGIEARDPAPFACPENPTYGCRYSDAALIHLDDNITFNITKIARTKFSDFANGSLELDPFNRVFTLQYRMGAFVGATLNKIGRTTGWTVGTVTNSCVGVVIPQSWTRLCQMQVNAGVGGGDSGSPVFGNVNLSSSTANLFGILWGRVVGEPFFFYSENWALELEIGCFTAVVNEDPCLEQP